MRVAFIGFGEVAAAFSSALIARGVQVAAHDVLLDQPDGSARLKSRAGGMTIEFCALPQAIGDASYVLSTVTTSVAQEAARRCVPHLHPGQTYVDFNATDPDIKSDIARIISPSGAAFVEGAVLGAVGVTGAKTEILLGGPNAKRAEPDIAGKMGLNARFYSEEIGKASMFKNLRSVFSKGLEALLVEFLTAGERAGIRADLWREVTELMANVPFDKTASNWVRTHATAHSRRLSEMKQVANVLRQMGLDPIMTDATVSFFARSGTLGLQQKFSAVPQNLDEVVGFFNERLKSGKAA
jgi:3-hydroxyisobutyrate dehydrogenase-like beta-hydroxyacid dehydrogenase